MKKWLITLVLFSEFTMAARIVDAYWDSQSRQVVAQIAYQGGCIPHQFSISWDSCVADATMNAVTRFGSVLDTGGQDTCSDEQLQTVRFSEPNDGCMADALILKSSSSKTSVFIPKQ